jgi:hypothetical protein
MLESTYAFKSFRVCLMKSGALTLGAYRLIIFISRWCIFSFIQYEMSFFISFHQCKFEIYFVRCKYCYSCLFSRAIDLVNLLPAFHHKPVFVSVNEWVSCKQQIVGSSFLIQFTKWCLLMGKLSLLMFGVNIDREVVIPAISCCYCLRT